MDVIEEALLVAIASSFDSLLTTPIELTESFPRSSFFIDGKRVISDAPVLLLLVVTSNAGDNVGDIATVCEVEVNVGVIGDPGLDIIVLHIVEAEEIVGWVPNWKAGENKAVG